VLGVPSTSANTLTTARVAWMRRALLAWHDAHGSDFPWRHARNPYSALVAGVCSQQTPMSRVLPLWARWTAAFSTLEECAAADRATVLRVWDGAGYPRRALALREAARVCMTQHGGELPREPKALLALPGVGPFTAAIVRCFGFADDAAAVDTNVVRVLGRLVLGDVQPALESARADIDAVAARLLPRGDAGRWNATLMDYGARVCTPRPRCDACVVRRQCTARARFARGAVATPVRAQPRFEGSDRQWRGRILRALRSSDGPMRVATLVRGLASDDTERVTVRRLLLALCDDGLAWSRGGMCGLGEPPTSESHRA
jgi:A/G-specific adenine glycosylase